MNDELNKVILKRISSDFETDLMRLIKTLNLISRSREIHHSLIEECRAITDKYKVRLNDYKIKLIDIDRQPAGEKGEGNKWTVNTVDSTNSLYAFADELRAIINDIGVDLDQSREGHSAKLDAIYATYELELQATQMELDSRLNVLTELLTKPAGEIAQSDKAEVNETVVKPPAMIEETRVQHYEAAEFREQRSPEPSSIGNGNLLIATAALFLGAILGIAIFYFITVYERPVGIVSESSSPSAQRTVLDAEPESEAVTETKPAQKPIETQDDDAPLAIAQAPEEKEPDPVVEDEDAEEIEASEELEIMDVEEDVQEIEASENVENIDEMEIAEVVTSPDATESVEDEVDVSDEQVLEAEPEVEQPVMYTVTGLGANVREGPGLSHTIVAVVTKGQVFEWLGDKSRFWLKIKTPAGTIGWVSGRAVREVN